MQARIALHHFIQAYQNHPKISYWAISIRLACFLLDRWTQVLPERFTTYLANTLFIRESLDHLVSNIDSWTREGCLVQNQIEFFLFRDFVDHFVGSFL